MDARELAEGRARCLAELAAFDPEEAAYEALVELAHLDEPELAARARKILEAFLDDPRR